jgi:hypothetical protein
MRYVMALAVVLVGCGAAEDNPELAEMEAVYRAGSSPYPSGYAGNGDIGIYQGASAASEDCLIYTTIGTDVHAGSASGPVIMTIVGNDIVDPSSGTVMCSRDGNELVERVRSGGADGPVLFTVMGRWIFEGDIDTHGKTWLEIVYYLNDQLLYTFQGAHVYEHAPYDGEILVTATKPIAQSDQMRKLVISSLIAAECGGLGLYGEDEDEEHEN